MAVYQVNQWDPESGWINDAYQGTIFGNQADATAGKTGYSSSQVGGGPPQQAPTSSEYQQTLAAQRAQGNGILGNTDPRLKLALLAAGGAAGAGAMGVGASGFPAGGDVLGGAESLSGASAGGTAAGGATGATAVQGYDPWGQTPGTQPNPEGFDQSSTVAQNYTTPGSTPGVPMPPDVSKIVQQYGPSALTAMQKLLGGGSTGGSGPWGSDADLMRMIGSLGAAGLGYLGSQSQTNAYKTLANQYMDMGAPYRARLADLYANPSSFLTSPEVTVPVQQGSDIMAHSLSVNGNPAGSGDALTQLQNYSSNQLFGRLGEEKNRLGTLGGISTFNAAAPTAASSAITSNAGGYNAIGSGVSDIFNPPKSMAQNLADFQRLSQGLSQPTQPAAS